MKIPSKKKLKTYWVFGYCFLSRIIYNSTNSNKIFCVAQHFCELILARRRRVQSRNKEVFSVDKKCNMCASFIYFLHSVVFMFVPIRSIQFWLKVRPQNIPHVQSARLKTMENHHQPKSIKTKIRRGEARRNR